MIVNLGKRSDHVHRLFKTLILAGLKPPRTKVFKRVLECYCSFKHPKLYAQYKDGTLNDTSWIKDGWDEK